MSEPAVSLLAAVFRGDDDSSVADGRARTPREARVLRLATSSDAPVEAEAALVARIVRGDAQGFRELIVQHFDGLARFATGMLGDRDAAEDAVQGVLTRLWERHDEFAPEMSVRAYLYRAVRNRALDAIDHAHVRARGHALLLHEQRQSHKSDVSSEHPGADALRRALGELTERRRTALRLRYEEGLTYPEIAAVMNISTASAEQLVFHAIRALRAMMGVEPNPKKI